VEQEKDCTVKNISRVNLRFKVDNSLRLANDSTFFYLFSFCERKTGFPIQHLRFCQSSLLIFYKLVIN